MEGHFGINGHFFGYLVTVFVTAVVVVTVRGKVEDGGGVELGRGVEVVGFGSEKVGERPELPPMPSFSTPKLETARR